MDFLRVGADALLVQVEDAGAAAALYQQARARSVVAADIVAGTRTVLFDGVADREALAVELAGWPSGGSTADPAPVCRVEVPTRYDGPDLEDVARRWDMTLAEAVGTHTGTEFVVAFCGFAPGFAYCTGLPERLWLPRLDVPRPSVPAGSVGLAAEFTGVYPTASPGGWRLIGHTDIALWDAGRDQPATLPPGARVRFVEA
jgi:KipI family sensor histidine kinase inhibitor